MPRRQEAIGSTGWQRHDTTRRRRVVVK